MFVLFVICVCGFAQQTLAQELKSIALSAGVRTAVIMMHFTLAFLPRS